MAFTYPFSPVHPVQTNTLGLQNPHFFVVNCNILQAIAMESEPESTARVVLFCQTCCAVRI